MKITGLLKIGKTYEIKGDAIMKGDNKPDYIITIPNGEALNNVLEQGGVIEITIAKENEK